jgi:hypothetical protein
MPSAFLALFIPICYNPIMPSALDPIPISTLDSRKIVNELNLEIKNRTLKLPKFL